LAHPNILDHFLLSFLTLQAFKYKLLLTEGLCLCLKNGVITLFGGVIPLIKDLFFTDGKPWIMSRPGTGDAAAALAAVVSAIDFNLVQRA
jgi:hypothetical protein